MVKKKKKTPGACPARARRANTPPKPVCFNKSQQSNQAMHMLQLDDSNETVVTAFILSQHKLEPHGHQHPWVHAIRIQCPDLPKAVATDCPTAWAPAWAKHVVVVLVVVVVMWLGGADKVRTEC